MLKIRVLNISKKDLHRTLKKFKGAAWDQSPIFKKLYERGVRAARRRAVRLPGRRLLLRPQRARRRAARRNREDRRRQPHAVHHLGGSVAVSEWTRGKSSPIRASSARSFPPRTMPPGGSLRDSDEARYIGMAMPRFLARRPYGAKSDPVEEFDFEEETSGSDVKGYSWANAAHAMAVNIKPLVQAVRLVLAHPRHRVGRRGGGTCPPTPFRPTTAAST